MFANWVTLIAVGCSIGAAVETKRAFDGKKETLAEYKTYLEDYLERQRAKRPPKISESVDDKVLAHDSVTKMPSSEQISESAVERRREKNVDCRPPSSKDNARRSVRHVLQGVAGARRRLRAILQV